MQLNISRNSFFISALVMFLCAVAPQAWAAPTAATPVISLAPGLYSGAQTVTITDTTPGATIYYTIDGTYPYSSSTAYSGSITVSTSETLTAVAQALGYSASPFAIAQYDIASSSSRFIYTIAGNNTLGYTGDGGPATFAELDIMQAVAVDKNGNVYIADDEENVVRKVTASTGIITTIAGTGVAGHTGDNGPAADAELWNPSSLAVDGVGNLFIGETGDNVVRRIDAVTGAITTFAGNPSGTGAINGPATDYSLIGIGGLALNLLGTTLYIANDINVVEVNTGNGVISLPNGLTSFPGFGYLTGITVDQESNIYVSDEPSNVVRKISPQGTISVFAGGAYSGGDGGPATSAALDYPAGLAVDSAGDLYIADNWHMAIREVNTSGIINTIVGHLYNPYADGGDGSPATNVGFFYPQVIAADPAGNVYFGDQSTYRVRKITTSAPPPSSAAASPVFSLAPGTYPDSQVLTMTDETPGAEIYVSLNGSTPTTAGQGYHGPIEITGTVTVQAIAIAPGYLASAPVSAMYIISTPPAAVISTVAGNGSYGFSGFGGPAIGALMGEPAAVAFDAQGNLYIADSGNAVVWMVAASSGNISVVAGTGTAGVGTDGVQATASELNEPDGLALDKAGNLYISDSNNRCVRRVNAETGAINTVAGPGASNALGDGGPATSANIGSPVGLAFDNAGNLYIVDSDHNRVRMIAANTGTIYTVAGGGTAGQLGDGGLATAAYVSYPRDVAVDQSGNLYILEFGDARIRKVEASTGVITTIAGNGKAGTTGDGGQATAAEIDSQQGIAVDGAGDVYLSSGPGAVRKIDAATGIITTVAGDGYFGFGGDGGQATMAELYDPLGLALNSTGSIFVADAGNYRIRGVTIAPTAATLVSPAPGLGTVLGTTNVTFHWTTFATASDYQLNLSAVAPGQSELFSYKGTATTATAATLPANGAEVYATLYTKINGVWKSNNYLYYESGPRLAALTYPTPGAGTLLGASNVTFQWTTGAEAADYQLNLSAIGPGQSELFSYKGTATFAVVPNLPASGATVYATLYSKIDGVWQSNAYLYTESGTPTPATLTSPTPGLTTILGTGNVAFQWTAGGGASTYQLNLSAITPGASDLFLYKGTASSAIAPTIPAHGVTVYATLYSKIKGAWQSNSYVYTESGSPTPAALTSPTPGLGTILGTTNVMFQWSAGTSASLYQLNLSKVAPGNSELYSYKGTALSATAPTLPANGVKVYARLYSKIDGIWLYNDYVYTEQ